MWVNPNPNPTNTQYNIFTCGKFQVFSQLTQLLFSDLQIRMIENCLITIINDDLKLLILIYTLASVILKKGKWRSEIIVGYFMGFLKRLEMNSGELDDER